MSDSPVTRRTALAAVGSAIPLGAAGCLGFGGVTGSDPDEETAGSGATGGATDGNDPTAGDGAAGSDTHSETDDADPGSPAQPIATAVDEPNEAVTVSMVGEHELRFEPQLVWVAVGGQVTWRNDDPDHGHDVATIAGRTPSDAFGWSTGTLKPDEMYTRTLTEPGVYDYVCTPHASRMVGRLVVGQPDPTGEPALSVGTDGIDGAEARAAFDALDDEVDLLLGETSNGASNAIETTGGTSGTGSDDSAECDCPE